MLLVGSIITALLAVMSVFVTALTVQDPAWKRRSIVTAVLLGFASLIVTVVTYEQTPGNSPVFSNAISGLIGIILIILSSRIFQLTAPLLVGMVLGWRLNAWLKVRGQAAYLASRNWKTGYDTLVLAEAGLVSLHEQKSEEIAALTKKMNVVTEKWRQLTSGEPTHGPYRPTEEIELEQERDKIIAELRKQQSASEIIWSDMQNSVHNKLASGELIARGFLMPMSSHPNEVVIPAAQWRFLRLKDSFKKASGDGVNYTGVTIAKR